MGRSVFQQPRRFNDVYVKVELMRVLNKKIWPFQLSIKLGSDRHYWGDDPTVNNYNDWLDTNLQKKVFIVHYQYRQMVCCFKDEHDMFMFKLAQGI